MSDSKLLLIIEMSATAQYFLVTISIYMVLSKVFSAFFVVFLSSLLFPVQQITTKRTQQSILFTKVCVMMANDDDKTLIKKSFQFRDNRKIIIHILAAERVRDNLLTIRIHTDTHMHALLAK